MFLSLSEVKAILDSNGLSPNKRFGQNFLIDRGMYKHMLEVADIHKNETIIEIGAGIGNLTGFLLDRAKKVISYEVDGGFLNILRKRFITYKNFSLIEGDFVKSFDSSLLTPPYKIVANIPYQITAKILDTFLRAKIKPQSLTLVMQYDVAEKITTSTPPFSRIGILSGLTSTSRIIKTIGKGSFWPRPDVNSALVHIDLDSSLHPHLDDILSLVKVGFSKRRKQLATLLATHLGIQKNDIISLFKTCSLDPGIRAESLSPKDWEQITYLITKR